MRIWGRSHYTPLSVDSESQLFPSLPISRLIGIDPVSMSALAIWHSFNWITSDNGVYQE
jgi:hypothetical protein